MRLPYSTCSETYVWYALDVAGARPRPPLPEGLALDVEPGGRPGSLVWSVLAGDEKVFGCWTHERRTPLRALPDGLLDLPPGVACLEDSRTAPAFRGQGVAPAAWAALADRLEGTATLVTKIRDDNAPSRRGVEKVGFAEVARMEVRQNGPLVRLRCAAADPRAAFLAERLDGVRALVRG